MKTVRIVLLLMIGTAAASGQSKTGTSAGQFLLIEPSARIAGMGNAGATVYGEVQSAYYNPASAGFLANNAVQVTHSLWLADISYDYVAIALSLGTLGNLTAAVTSLNSGDIEVRTVDQPLGIGEFYSVTDVAIGVGFARQVSDRFSVGVQVNYVQETIWHTSMNAFGLNVGTLYRLSEDGLHIGASISNFGTRGMYEGRDLRVQYDRDPDVHGDNSSLPASQLVEDFPLPIVFRVGFGYPVAMADDHTVRFALDAFHPSDNTESVSFGVEYAFQNMFFLRGGYQNLFLQDSEVGLTFGGGVRYIADIYGLSVDYAWADHGRLLEAHRFTLGITF